MTQGLSSVEAESRLARLGEPEPPNSRSVASIVTANVLTLFNAIIGGFFILILSLGLWADAIFGLIAIVNSAIGIRQELKAKETLDQLALLVAPRAKAIRDGRAGRADAPTRSCPATSSGSSRATSWSPTDRWSTPAG